MRMLGTISDQEQAGRFGDYLLSRGIANQVEPGSGGWLIWVADDDKLDAAKYELTAFQAGPDAPQFRTASRRAEEIRAEKEREAKRREGKVIDVRTSMFAGAGRTTPVTIVLIAICLLVGLLTKFGSEDPKGREVLYQLVMSPPGGPDDYYGLGLIFRGQVWRLFTFMFIHFGFLHLLFNMMWLFDLGGLLERKRHSLWLAAFIFSAAIFSGLAQHFMQIDFRLPGLFTFLQDGLSGGMSGVVYALFGYAWIRGRLAPYDRIQPSSQTTTLMIVWLFVCMTGWIGHVANMGHLSGLVFGMAVAWVPMAVKRLRRS